MVGTGHDIPAPALLVIHCTKGFTRIGGPELDLPMQDVAEACGYASYTYLGHIFKKETGISPGRYRNQTRRNSAELP